MPMAKFIFDGINKLFIARSGIQEVDVQIDLYSDWKEVLLEDDNLKYLQGMSTVGGDELTLGRTLGATFFLENGWKIRPYEGENHTLRINGNLFSRDGSGAVIPTTGETNVLVEMFVSNLIDTVSPSTDDLIAGGVATTGDIDTQTTTLLTGIPPAVIEELNSTGNTYDGVPFTGIMEILLSMAQGRILESASGVYNFYSQDDTSVLYTLTKSGVERNRS